MPNRFFGRLAQALIGRGSAVYRINFNAGDQIFWPLKGAINFRGRPLGWPEFLRKVIAARRITDLILFGDCRPLHQAAIQIARQMRVNCYVCEEGYLRPHWVTFERDGVNGNSTLPRDAEWFRRTAVNLPPLEPTRPVFSSFPRRAREDLLYNATAIAFGLLYPHYRSHRPRPRLVEYAGWSWKVIRRPLAHHRAKREALRLSPDALFYLFPLQLNCDTQISQHSSFSSIVPVIELVLASFAIHAPPDSLLVIKEHPLDDGLINWRRIVSRLARQHHIARRVIYLEIGNTDGLIARGCGVVTVNSTVGLMALASNVPVQVLGDAIYDIEGMTHQGGLDAFWKNTSPPDASLFEAFRKVLMARCVLAGGFFGEDGLARLVDNAVDRLEQCLQDDSVQPLGLEVRDELTEVEKTFVIMTS